MTLSIKKLTRFRKVVAYATVVLAMAMLNMVTILSNSAKAFEGGQWILTVNSCTSWTCTKNGGVGCPGPDWIPPGC